ncbi:MAG: LysM peptidoglycan-binding domain-containing protein [Anaerolineaceae bacterium]|nr:LysM peptidoglycan-binding domain-containing protein [Anaerolineaceae bacterium]
MDAKKSPQDVIQTYQRRQQFMPFVIGGLAVLLVVVGVIFIVLFFTGRDDSSVSSGSETETVLPTDTKTSTPVPPTFTPSLVPTETIEPTLTVTPTPSGPFEYTVQENDTCWDIAVTFEVELTVLQAINNFGGGCPIQPGQKILIPAPDQRLPTATFLPTGLAYGTKLEYVIQVGDTLDLIASLFNTTVESIIEENKLEDANTIFAGQSLIIKANIVTPTVTIAVTSTSDAPAAPQETATP